MTFLVGALIRNTNLFHQKIRVHLLLSIMKLVKHKIGIFMPFQKLNFDGLLHESLFHENLHNKKNLKFQTFFYIIVG